MVLMTTIFLLTHVQEKWSICGERRWVHAATRKNLDGLKQERSSKNTNNSSQQRPEQSVDLTLASMDPLANANAEDELSTIDLDREGERQAANH